jgi:hypothetical protein
MGGGGYGAGGGGGGNGAGDYSHVDGGGDGAPGMVYVEWQNSNDFVAQAAQSLTRLAHRGAQSGG